MRDEQRLKRSTAVSIIPCTSYLVLSIFRCAILRGYYDTRLNRGAVHAFRSVEAVEAEWNGSVTAIKKPCTV
jgi:hypothetical protein